MIMFSEKLEGLLGLIYRHMPTNTGKHDIACNKDLLAKAEAFDVDVAMNAKEPNALFIKDFALPQELPESKRRITAVEIYMLCPQLGSIYHDSDVERFIGWFSKLPMSSQRTERMANRYRPRHIGEELESISTTICKNDANTVEQDEGCREVYSMPEESGKTGDYH
jgi:hypothetical protein